MSDRYPVLDYFLKNSDKFRLIQAFNKVINCCNILYKFTNTKVIRGYCKNYKFKDFAKMLFDRGITIREQIFFDSWREISKKLS
jgi:hypothetical protein